MLAVGLGGADWGHVGISAHGATGGGGEVGKAGTWWGTGRDPSRQAQSRPRDQSPGERKGGAGTGPALQARAG